jgi:hypothetical protein
LLAERGDEAWIYGRHARVLPRSRRRSRIAAS